MRAYLLIAAILLFGDIALAQRAPSVVIFPPQSLPVKFSHKNHMSRVPGRDCEYCHDKAAASTSASDMVLPKADSCHEGCHNVDMEDPNKVGKKAPARCDACHLGPDPTKPARFAVPTPNLKFNHKMHADRQIPCARCHGDMNDIDLATRENLPRMPLCLGCHNAPLKSSKGALPAAMAAATPPSQRGPAKCSTCHLVLADNTLQTQFPTGILAPSGTLKGDAHTPQFAREHARVAATDPGYCATCHRQDFCNSCHNSVVRPMSFHGNDYVSIHPVEARKQTTNCQGCHRLQTFCLGCHERAGVVDQATLNARENITAAGRRFHPPYQTWVAAPRTPEHHSWQAERNLRQCVSCHREESCMQCHAAKDLGGAQPFRVSPHPIGFADSRECRAMSSRNGRVCLKCHGPDDARINCGR